MDASSNFHIRLNGAKSANSGNTVTVGNVAYRVVGTASNPAQNQATLSNTTANGIQATAVLASSLNGQFYVIGNPSSEVLTNSRSIAPRVGVDTVSASLSSPSMTLSAMTSGVGGPNPRHDRRRATHNEVERRRRDNINAWIMKLGRQIPMDPETGPPKSNNLSKGGILARACDFINELRETNRDLMAKLGGGLTVRENDFISLQRQNEELKQQNALLRQQLDNLSKQLESHEGIETILS